MGYDYYQVKRVFVACPGDLMSERSRIPALIDEINQLSAHSKGLHLDLVGWENILPDMGRPQEIINRELETSDLVIIIFWRRIGSPSRSHNELDAKLRKDRVLKSHLPKDWSYPITGTVEEFCIASEMYQAKQRPMIGVYFKRVSDEDRAKISLNEDEVGQLEQVEVFKKHLESGKNILLLRARYR